MSFTSEVSRVENPQLECEGIAHHGDCLLRLMCPCVTTCWCHRHGLDWCTNVHFESLVSVV